MKQRKDSREETFKLGWNNSRNIEGVKVTTIINVELLEEFQETSKIDLKGCQE